MVYDQPNIKYRNYYLTKLLTKTTTISLVCIRFSIVKTEESATYNNTPPTTTEDKIPANRPTTAPPMKAYACPNSTMF